MVLVLDVPGHRVQVALPGAGRPVALALQLLAVRRPGPVDHLDPAGAVQQHRGRGQGLQDRAQLGQRRGALLRGVALDVDVAEEGGEAAGVGEGPDLVPAAQRRVVVLEVAGPAVGEHGPVLVLDDRAGDLREAGEGLLADQVLGAAVQQAGRGGVHVGEAPAAVDAVDGVGDRGEGVDGSGAPALVSVHPARSLSPAAHVGPALQRPRHTRRPPTDCAGRATQHRG